MCIYIKYIAYKTVGYNYTFYFCFDFYFFCKFQSSFIALGAKLYDFSPRLTCSPLLSLSHSSVATQALLWPGHSYEALCWGSMGWYIRSKVWWLYWCYKKWHLGSPTGLCQWVWKACPWVWKAEEMGREVDRDSSPSRLGTSVLLLFSPIMILYLGQAHSWVWTMKPPVSA